MEVDHPAAEPAFVQQLELQANMAGKGRLAVAHNDWGEEEVAFVDEARPERVGGEVGAPTVRSAPADVLISRTASGLNSRSIRVLAVDGSFSVLEYTILSAACQICAKSR